MYNNNNRRNHQHSYRNGHSSQEHFPIAAVHDLIMPDTDSGFGSSLQTKMHTYDKKENFNPKCLMRSYSLSQLPVSHRNTQNSEILNNSFSAFESTDPIMKELKECLAESENRRATLIQKLKAAQGTLQLQSDRLTKIEVTSKGNNSMLNELKKKESDYKKRLSEMEKMKHERNKLQRENKHLKQEMQIRVENLHAKLKTLQSQHELCDSEGAKRVKLLEHSSKTIKILEEENYKLLRENGAGKTEIDIYKESLRLLKQRCSLLEEKNKSLSEEFEKFQEANQELQTNLEETEKRLIEEAEQAELFQKENEHLANGWKNLTDEKDFAKEQLVQCNHLLAEEKSQVLNLCLQKDTLEHQLKETEIRNKQLKNDKESLNQDNFRLQDQLNIMQHEITTEKLAIANLEENKRKLEEEFCAVKKVCEELSGELCTLKGSYEEVLERVSDSEKKNSHLTQMCHTLQQEKQHLEQNINQMKKIHEETKIHFRSEKNNFEGTINRLKEEIKYNSEIQVQQKDKCFELEQKLQMTIDELSASSTGQKEELSGWKNTCERLTGALNRKEKEIQLLADKCGDLEDVTLQLKLEVHDYKDQINNIHRLKEENRRLLQEKHENEQLIQLLETEKEVLSRNAKRDLDTCQREISKMELDMDSQKQTVADLQQTNEFLVEKVELCEKENEELRTSLSKEAEISADEEKDLKISYDLLYDEHSQLKEEYNNLLGRHECLMNNLNDGSTIPEEELNEILKEKEGLEREIDQLNGKISLIEGNQKESVETIKKMEEVIKIKAENESLKNNCENESMVYDGAPPEYQILLDKIKQELEETKKELKNEQEAYKLLKQELEEEKVNKPIYIEESLADVDNDLQQMRQELHKLMGVIEIKDEEIDSLSKQLKAAQTQLFNQEETMKEMKETLKQVEKKTDSEITASNAETLSKENGDHIEKKSVEQITSEFPTVTLRSSSMVESLSSVDDSAKSADSSSLPSDERLQSLIAKYRSPSNQSGNPENNRIGGRPHSVGPGSSFSGMSRILGLTTPKPFYLSSVGSKFNRMSGSSLGTGISSVNVPATTASAPTISTSAAPAPTAPATTGPAPTVLAPTVPSSPVPVSVSPAAPASAASSGPTSPVPLSTDAPVVSLPSESNKPVSSVDNMLKPSCPPKVSNRPPVPPPRPASRPSSAHVPEAESPVNGVMSPPSPATTVDSTIVDASEEEAVDANMIITI